MLCPVHRSRAPPQFRTCHVSISAQISQLQRKGLSDSEVQEEAISFEKALESLNKFRFDAVKLEEKAFTRALVGSTYQKKSRSLKATSVRMLCAGRQRESEADMFTLLVERLVGGA